MQKIIGYHGTKERFAESIIRDGFKNPEKKKENNHWLGHGIYFYSDYELAEWWGQKKVDVQNSKYGESDKAVVIKGVIEGDIVWDLDNPFTLKKFKECQKSIEERIVSEGVVLDFSKDNVKEKNVNERIRCFWMDAVKEEEKISVIIYTFSKDKPSYIDSKCSSYTSDDYSLKNMGLAYHEKQICVTDNRFIVKRSIVNGNVESFGEVIV